MEIVSQLFNAIKNASLETIVVGIGAILIIVIALLADRLINGEDNSNTYRSRHDRP